MFSSDLNRVDENWPLLNPAGTLLKKVNVVKSVGTITVFTLEKADRAMAMGQKRRRDRARKSVV